MFAFAFHFTYWSYFMSLIQQANIFICLYLNSRTVDKTNFKSVVSLCPIGTSESPHIHLVVVTGKLNIDWSFSWLFVYSVTLIYLQCVSDPSRVSMWPLLLSLLGSGQT